MAKYKVIKMGTTDGDVYTLFRDFGGHSGEEEWGSLQSPRYYKTKERAEKEIRRRLKLGI